MPNLDLHEFASMETPGALLISYHGKLLQVWFRAKDRWVCKNVDTDEIEYVSQDETDFTLVRASIDSWIRRMSGKYIKLTNEWHAENQWFVPWEIDKDTNNWYGADQDGRLRHFPRYRGDWYLFTS